MSDLIERLERLSVCEPGCNGRCVECPQDVVNEAAAAPRAQQPITAQEAWQELIEKDDRTSPAEYPEMALITQEELANYMAGAMKPQPIETAPRDGWEPTHIHYKGGEYRVLFEALQTDQTPAGAHVVVYDNREGQCFVRPKFMFIEPGRFTSTPPQEK